MTTCPHAVVFAHESDIALCWPAVTPEAVWLDPRLYHLGHGEPAPTCPQPIMLYAPRLSLGWVLDVPAHLTEAFWDDMQKSYGDDLPQVASGLPGGRCDDNIADPFGGDQTCWNGIDFPDPPAGFHNYDDGYDDGYEDGQW